MDTRLLGYLIVIVIQITVCCAQGWSLDDDLVVQTEYGLVQGTTTKTTKVWYGIPYAAPPVGNLRWQPPSHPTAWSNTRNATDPNVPVCPQPNPIPNQQEDCLYLNVYSPLNSSSSSSPLPVYFWIHGGSLIDGSGIFYNPEWLMTYNNMVVVTINYRLGALGFLANPALMAASVPTTGFYGIQDQRLALEWIRYNIKGFGGNPYKVTVAGESAGAASVYVHLVAPRSAGLFNQAVMESGYCDMWTESQAYSYSDVIINNLKCNSSSPTQLLSCLHAATPSELLEASTPITLFNPMLHPYEITQQPIVLVMNNSFNAVPLLAGTNLDENSLFLCPSFPNGLNSSEYLVVLTEEYGQTKAAQLSQEYPISEYSDALQALIAVESDAFFKCPTKALAYFWNYHKSPAYMYSFEHTPSFSQGPCYGVAHSYELPFLFPDLVMNLTSQEWEIAENMRDAWSSYITTGAPSMSRIPTLTWSQVGILLYSSVNYDYMILDVTPRMESRFDVKCEYWQT